MSEKKRLRSTHAYTGATRVIVDKPCYIHALYISSGTSQTADVYCYDNASAASGNMVLGVDPSAQGVFSIELPEPGILCENGLTMKVESYAVTVVYSLLRE